MLARMRRKVNYCTLLVGMQVGAATMENSMEFPQEIKNRTTVWSSNPTSGLYPKEMKPTSQRDICTPMFTAALFIIVKVWKQPKSLSMHELIKKMWYIYNIYIIYYVYYIYNIYKNIPLWNIIQPQYAWTCRALC